MPINPNFFICSIDCKCILDVIEKISIICYNMKVKKYKYM